MDFSSFNTTCTPIMRCVHQAHIIKFVFQLHCPKGQTERVLKRSVWLHFAKENPEMLYALPYGL